MDEKASVEKSEMELYVNNVNMLNEFEAVESCNKEKWEW